MSDLSSPSQSDPPPPNSHRSSHTSIALIVTSLFAFLVFFFLSVYRHPSRRTRPTSSRSMTNDKFSSTHKPILWEVCLDEDPYNDLTRLDGAVHNWQPVTAWRNYRLGRRPSPRCRPPVAVGQYPLSEQNQSHASPSPHLAPPLRYPDHRTLNVAVLVAMPSRRPPAEPTHGTAPHHSHPIGSRLSYGEGQLLIGTTTVSCSRRVLSTTLANQPIA